MSRLRIITIAYIAFSTFYLAVTLITVFYNNRNYDFPTFNPIGVSNQRRDSNSDNVNNKNTTLRIMSWNIKNGSLKKNSKVKSLQQNLMQDTDLTESEAKKKYYENWHQMPWKLRRDELSHQVLFYNPDIFCIQEALHNQVTDINERFDGAYGWVGVGREDGQEKGEIEAIFYKKTFIELKNSSTFWLSDTPFKPSHFNDTNYNRTVTVANLETKKNNLPLTVLNTHLEVKKESARIKSAQMLKQSGAYEYSKHGGPVFVTGDFNSAADGEGSGGYKVATSSSSEVNNGKSYNKELKNIKISNAFTKKYNSSLFNSFSFSDLYKSVNETQRLGHFATSTGFRKVNDDKEFERIDFLLAGDINSKRYKNGWKAIRYFCPGNFPDTRYHLSDHRPVIVDVVVESTK